MKQFLILLSFIFYFCSCTPKVCPTYATQEVPIKKEKDRISNAEKTGAVLFTVFVIYAINNNKN